MKKVLLIFFSFFSILRADYLISNGEIALFYDGKNNIIKNIRGEIYHNDKIANIEVFLEKDYKIYKARDYYTRAKYVEGKNMFELKYNILGQSFTTYIIASNINKKNLYIYTDLSKVKWNNNYRILYKVSPIELTGTIVNDKYDYVYDNMYIQKDRNSQVYLTTENDLEKFKLRLLETSLRKRIGERIFVEKNILPNTKGDFLTINFQDSNFLEKKEFSSILNDEFIFWKDQDAKFKFLPKRMIKIMRDFYLLESNDYVQTKLDINRGKENYLNKLRYTYINTIINKDKFDNSFFSELLFKKNIGMEKIYYYYYFIKIAKLRGIDLTKDKTIKNIISELRKNLQKGYEEIANKEGNWKLNSYMYCEFIDLLEKVIDTKIVWENIDYIKDDVKRNLISEILDSQNIIKKYSYIKYIRLLPKDILKKNIDILLKKVQTPIGVLTENNRVKYVANLQLALILYENGYLVQSNKILERVIYFYNNSHAKDNITTEKIFLYIENIYYRGLL